MTDLRPTVGGDVGAWGTDLLNWLGVSINPDGTLSGSLTAAGAKIGNLLLPKASALVRQMVSETVMASPPTVTVGTASTAITSSVLTAENATSNPFRYEHVFATVDNGSFLAPKSPTNSGGISIFYSPWRIAFDTDAPKFEFLVFGNGTQFRIWINEQLVSASATSVVNDSANHLVLVDFSAVGSRAYRRIVIELAGSGTGSTPYFGGVRCLATDTLQPPMIPAGPALAIFGDSYTVGNDGTLTTSNLGFASRLSRLLGIPNTKILPGPGTGFLRDSAPNLHYLARVGDLASANPDVLLVQGSINDQGVWSSGAVQAAVTQFHQSVRASFPKIPVFYTGVLRPRNLVGNDASVEAEIKAAVAASDSLTYYIDPHPSGAPAWFNGTGKSGTPTDDGNADFCLATDGAHPTSTIGHDYLARRIAQQMAATLAINV